MKQPTNIDEISTGAIQIEVTTEMIAAGVGELARVDGLVLDGSCSAAELAERVYKVMQCESDFEIGRAAKKRYEAHMAQYSQIERR